MITRIIETVRDLVEMKVDDRHPLSVLVGEVGVNHRTVIAIVCPGPDIKEALIEHCAFAKFH